ncbi:MAG: hypothetical protein CV082_07110 [Candidatus Brocadia sp. BL1]|nr:MAG: hypothetical protein CV082_07110 [Candidatus Brocadia sp. BL1]
MKMFLAKNEKKKSLKQMRRLGNEYFLKNLICPDSNKLCLRLPGGMDKLICLCYLNIYMDVEYIILTNKVCQYHPITRLNKMKIPIPLS